MLNTSPGSSPAKAWLPGLDALRAFSIAWVVWFHMEARDHLLPDGLLREFVLRGISGVTIFFVISGFLITTLLLNEEEASGRICLRDFYRRRAYRILPAAGTYLVLAFAFAVLAGLPLASMEWLSAAFFFRNLLPTGEGSGLTEHFWSLSIEEQFYLIWPIIVVLVPGRRRIWLTLGLCLIAPVWRHLVIKMAGGGGFNINRIDFHYDSLLVGALLALLQKVSGFRGILDRVPVAPILLPAAIVALFAQLHWGLPFGVLGVVGGATVRVGLIALVIKILVEGRCRWAQGICRLSPVVWLGRLSFSLYLWQTLFCSLRFDHWLWKFPVCLVAPVACATASYFLVERPLLRLRDQGRPRSPQGTDAPAPAAKAP